jgi:hypothetical protein
MKRQSLKMTSFSECTTVGFHTRNSYRPLNLAITEVEEGGGCRAYSNVTDESCWWLDLLAPCIRNVAWRAVDLLPGRSVP